MKLDLIDRIKSDILAGVFERGLPIRQQFLSERYGVSRIPVRDSLTQLKAEGWLVKAGKAGVMVPNLDAQVAEDLYWMRSILEPKLLSLAFANMTHEQLGKAKDTNLLLDNDTLLLIEKGKLNWQFHAILYAPANRVTLFETVQRLNIQAIQYLGFQYGPMSYRDVSQQEHQDMLRLIEERQYDEAQELLRAHILQAGIKLVDYLKAL
ncbi:GntR family transcriptional regulator [Marinomonas mediterranea]|uniref:Transcriptional regulator, GntR family n=1 Tax=Marinomonas mediterranea (strain ATCC 700492 / JCM 21426 / NBRC 103028 / MMB-1) TaxID=717774 RepID=F2K3D1_MARM1|nr:GntR family transcriptional regulator [Marinomonas mediterranea]ADZ91273.1 transcriptional regulator, GntR family [Marinomonas mediterranea MMB-1]